MKLEKYEKKAAKADKKLQKARNRLPKKRRVRVVRSFNSETGKVSHNLVIDKQNVLPKDSLIKKARKRTLVEIKNKVHEKISEVEHENPAVEAAHATERKAEEAVALAKKIYGNKSGRYANKLKKLEKKSYKASAKYEYAKYENEKRAEEKKLAQKHAEYKKRTSRKKIYEQEKEKVVDATKKGLKSTAEYITDKIKENKKKIIFILISVFLVFAIVSSVSSCAAMFTGGASGALGNSFLSLPKDIDDTEEDYVKKELQLTKKIENVETDHPDFDEYRYNIAEIGHNPLQLIAYLSAKNIMFTHASIGPDLADVFSAMYDLKFKALDEVRTRTEIRTGHRTIHKPDGTVYEEDYDYEVEVEYTVKVLETTLAAKKMNEIADEKLNEDQKKLYVAYNTTRGGLQQFASPVNLFWHNYICSYYGTRRNPNDGNEEKHEGIDIALPEGIKVHAGMNGTITETGYDSYFGKYIRLADSRGFEIFYAHLSEILVSDGDEVKQEMVIGKTGDSGICYTPHIHVEVSANGETANPLFYFDVEQATLYGEGPDEENVEDMSPDYDGDAGRRIIEEGKKYLNYPYVWGGSNPTTSFDCSGFVCWSVTHSGVRNIPRTSAQGIYDLCTPISASEAKPGDLVFFTRTYNSGTPVSHVGIYCGNNIMLHCGDPIKYTRITTTYWTNHFYGFGRP